MNRLNRWLHKLLGLEQLIRDLELLTQTQAIAPTPINWEQWANLPEFNQALSPKNPSPSSKPDSEPNSNSDIVDPHMGRF